MDPGGGSTLRQLADLQARQHCLDTSPASWVLLQDIAGAGLFFLAVDTVLTYGPPARWLRKKYRQWAAPGTPLGRVDRMVGHANTRLVGLLHIAVQIPRAARLLRDPALLAAPIYACTPASLRVMTFSAGYFCYDLFVHATRFEYWANLAHAAGAAAVFTLGVAYGFLHYYGAMFLMWELSTPFVFLRWILHELGHAGSRLYVANGLTMMLVFGACRNVWGAWMSADFWRQSGAALASPIQNGIPAGTLWLFRLLNLGFNGLNALWFYKMVRGALKVFGRGKERGRGRGRQGAGRAAREPLNGDLSKPLGAQRGGPHAEATATANVTAGPEPKGLAGLEEEEASRPAAAAGQPEKKRA